MPIIINGKVYNGSNVTIRGSQVVIDGKPQGDPVNGVVEVRITEGTPVSVQSDMDVHCGDVAGDVTAGMDVECGSVGGSARAGMSITCGDVSGDINAGMGVSMGRRR